VYEHLAIERRGEVTVVRIDRPPANALDPVLLSEGARCVEELAAEPPGAVVLTGREQFFSAGMDLKLAPNLSPEGQREVVGGINSLFAAWYAFPRPVVAAVNGHAIAGGLILALCADYRVGSSTGPGRFGLTELRAGIPYPAAAMAVVRAELSPPAARMMVLRAHLVDAAEAAALGVLDELVDGDPLPRAVALAKERAALPAMAYERIKRQLRAETIAATGALARSTDPMLAGWLGEETAQAAAETLRAPDR
jgi:enoyl-CoA hydratase/carnithine racemase